MKSHEFIKNRADEQILAPKWHAPAVEKMLAFWQGIANKYNKPFKVKKNPVNFGRRSASKFASLGGTVNIGDVVIEYDTGVKYKFGAFAYFHIQIMNNEYGYDGAINKMDLQPNTFEYEMRYRAIGTVYRDILEPNTASNLSKDETQNRYGILGYSGGPAAFVFERIEPVYQDNAQAAARANKPKRDPGAEFAAQRQDPTNSVQKDSGNYQ